MGEQELRALVQSWAKPVRVHTHGAPYQVGDFVEVVTRIDVELEDPDDETPSHIGRAGAVAYLEYSCGCGQTYPTDPMIAVRFPEGDMEEFWREELARAPV